MAVNPSPDGRGWPIFRSLQGLTLGGLGQDLPAGLTLAAIAVPEQMATSRLGGFPPEVGLIAFVAAALGFAAFGANRQLSAGADSTITPIFAGSLAAVATVGSPHYAALASALALMVGVILVVAGRLKLGWIADLLSRPVLTGFLAGIALHIVLSQAPSILGLPENSGSVFQRVSALTAGFRAINPTSIAIGLGVFAVTFGAEKLNARIPGALIAMVGATLATVVFELERHGVQVLGHVSAGIPAPGFPYLGLQSVRPLVGLAFVVSLVVMVQTGATTRSFSGEDGDPDVNRDYVGVGVGSILGGVFGAFPVNASPPRTAAVADSGGSSQCSGLLAAAVILVLVVFGTQWLAHVPTAALAGVLLFVAQRIFHVRSFLDIRRRAPAEFWLALGVTALIIALPIQTGVAIGMFLSLAHGIFTISRAQPIPFERVSGTTVWWPASRESGEATEVGVIVMGFQAPLSFLNAYEFRRGMFQAIMRSEGVAHLFVLEASSIVEIDFTASAILSEVIEKARRGGMDFAIARLESVRAQAAFERFGITSLLGQDHVFRSVDEAIRALGSGRHPTLKGTPNR
jgi:SulP family sulfate permease